LSAAQIAQSPQRDWIIRIEHASSISGAGSEKKVKSPLRRVANCYPR
jgi:hypothetical protein